MSCLQRLFLKLCVSVSFTILGIKIEVLSSEESAASGGEEHSQFSEGESDRAALHSVLLSFHCRDHGTIIQK